ncbi:diguanylate cyclase [Hippea maritima]|uniref:diguanylate cyclase n=1 Tax=Hippea maritima (strain ATCC 700847 / DSM 10411 / MH2) TaxID=760142 RepID=F2LW78_HIPMA|nr:diguanylate cyclase [Hippea maritima]AEA34012.1 diguanylate cyclase [Hippea maritima DSM 10411]
MSQRRESDKLSAIIKEALYRATKRNMVLTPFNYYKVFTEVALEYGLDESEVHKMLYGMADVSASELEDLKKRVLEISTNVKDVTVNMERTLQESEATYDMTVKNIDEYRSKVDNSIASELEKIKYINSSLKAELEAARNVLEKQRKAIENIKDLSLKDHLTGLYLRKYMNEVLDSALYNFNRYSKVFSIIMLDLDDFKKINDTYGHLAGDEVLKVVGSVLKRITRRSDIPIRYGGDEFIVILPETKLEDAMIVAKKIKDKIASITFKKDKIEFKCTASIGITQVREGDTVESLLERVDKALYQTKNSQKGEISVVE